MNWTIEDVKEFAKNAHTGQKRWSGADYYEEHLLAVLANTEKMLSYFDKNLYRFYVSSGFSKSEVLAASLLHDILEDTKVTYQELAENFGSNVAEIVHRLTRPRNEEYAEYICQIADCGCVFTKLIKLADIEHNSSNFPIEKRNNKYSKYLLSKRILNDSLWELE